MIHQQIDPSRPKGWFVGPWNSEVPIPIGYANQGINEPHLHEKMFEVYLVAQGWSIVVVSQQSIRLEAGHMLVIEPGEVHTFIESSAEYLHFVIHTPFVPGDKIMALS
ncbi:MAG TPA: cupin domain-containing protein [Chloroflexota bacterium]|nr:cupin domain-containing protein [Chloroflexota bacterium]HUM68736.1 cupin domain-containing protein [Chloroflexota bacterium]